MSRRPEGTDRARLRLVVLDVPTDAVAATVAFWSAALGARVEEIGPPNDAFTLLADVHGPAGEIGILVQDTGPDGTPGIHLDLHVPDPASRDLEVARLQDLGATIVAHHQHWVVLRAPSGHTFCVVPDRKDQP